MKKCNSCGMFSEDENLFCDNCGARLPDATPVYTAAPAPAPAPKKKKTGLIIAIVAVILAVAAAVAVYFIFFADDDKESSKDSDKDTSEEVSTEDGTSESSKGDSASKTAAKNFANAFFKNFDAEEYLDCFPEEYVNYLCKTNNMDYDTFAAEGQRSFDERKASLRDTYGDFEVDIDIEKSGELSANELTELKSYLENTVGFEGELEQAVAYTVVVTYTDEYGAQVTASRDIPVYLYKGEWYPFEG